MSSKSSFSRSPSPNRPANPRNSEIGNPMRRSFTGNPFAKPSVSPNQRAGFNFNAPVSSSSDYSRRNSTGRESVIVSTRDYEDKENSKDQKLKLGNRSPASSTGVKHFMSPTISAASKVNASPRKKILAERNESVRTSVSISNGNGPLKEHSEFKPEKGLNQKKGVSVSFDPVITYVEDKELEATNCYENDFDPFSERLAAENDIVNLDPSFKISPRTSTSSLPSPALAPLDADPSMPPYDLETNYVSPRPQFLHYKPNPLVKMYLTQRDGKQLEESFTSESSSDAEITEQETISEESSLDSHMESKDEEEEVAKEEEELPVSEPNPIAMFEGAIEARKAPKRHFLFRPKFTALLFVLALAGLWASVSDSPIMEPSVLNNLNFPNLYVPPEILQFTRENLEGLIQKFRRWLYESLAYIHDLVISFREWHNPGQVKFANLTVLLEESSVDDYLLVGHSTFVAEIMKPIEADKKVEQGPEIQPSHNADEDEAEAVGDFVEERHSSGADESYEEVSDGKGEESEYQETVVPDNDEALGVVNVPESEAESLLIQTVEMTTNANEAAEDSNVATEVTRERVDIAENITALPTADVAEQSVAPLNAEIEPEAADNVISPVEIESTTPEPVDRVSTQAMMRISLLTALTLLAVVPFIYMKNRTSGAPGTTMKTSQVPVTKKVDHSPLLNAFQERSFSRHWPEEVETVGQPSPSETSSYLQSSYSSKHGKGGTSEAQSQVTRKPRSNNRRESMASSDSSMGSASYGSFTTYEKVPFKLDKGEEEFLTPVRRSSRIRKQVTSP